MGNHQNKNFFKILERFSVKKIKKDQLLIFLLAGVLLLVISMPVENGKSEIKKESSKEKIQNREEDYVSYMEKHLEEVLTQMEGVGDVTVMITLKSSAEKIVEKDTESEGEKVTESDSSGGTRLTENENKSEITVYSQDNTQGQEPYISKEISPKVEGVVVLASGGNQAMIKQNISEAVQALFDVDTHKIRIMKKN